MPDIIIRRAVLDDLPAIQDLNHKLFEFEDAHEHTLNMQWSYDEVGKNFLQRFLMEAYKVCFVAEHEGKLIGYLNGSLLTIDSVRPIVRAQLVNLFVEENWQNQHIGTHLTEKFMSWAKEKGAERIVVMAKAYNENALRFYEKEGFSEYLIHLEKDI